MILKRKPFPTPIVKLICKITIWFHKRRFNKMVLFMADLKPNHSYLLMSNHFSFLDGVFATYIWIYGLDKATPIKGFYAMSLKQQLLKNKWLMWLGSFSIEPDSRSMVESLNYAAELLSTPGNAFLFYPQGELESQHVRNILLKKGFTKILSKVACDCQLLWTSNIIEYFESTKPTINMHMLDCGTNKDFNFEDVQQKIDKHHQESIQKHIRFTKEA
ncbi:glycerol acyltransferase [Pedobacter sp. MC2016-24]|nr:glycerol acyltransferase [Pedobacter sp. MC2016-24]